ncbi:MAG TPA: thioredoxin [Sulfurimonas sp. UBA12504]|nr:MAG: thioredoxin [Sulfurimonas sp. GWF2_37_8]DAB29822.1 MAG TPA: thioredoxin [Sulfurimonas sp. UBA12504]
MVKIFVFLVITFAASLMGAEIPWAKDFKSGVETAKKVNKPVLFVFSRHTCKYCVILEETTFKDAKVIEALSRDFVSIVSYTDENDFTPQELWRPGTPTLWFLLPSGEPMFQPLMGAVDAENFLKALAIVKEEFDTMKTEK